MFLPFGTIAPGILLSLLGFAYMLFFGSYALNRASKDDQPGTPGKQILAEMRGTSFSEASTFFFPVPDDNHDAVTEQTDGQAANIPAVCLRIIIPDEDPYSDPCQFRLFARPPPVTTVA